MKISILTTRSNIKGATDKQIPIEVEFLSNANKGKDEITFEFKKKQDEFFAIDIKSAIFLAENILKLIELNNAKQ